MLFTVMLTTLFIYRLSHQKTNSFQCIYYFLFISCIALHALMVEWSLYFAQRYATTCFSILNQQQSYYSAQLIFNVEKMWTCSGNTYRIFVVQKSTVVNQVPHTEGIELFFFCWHQLYNFSTIREALLFVEHPLQQVGQP